MQNKISDNHIIPCQKILKERNIAAYLLSTKDEFLGEFVAKDKERLKWLSGFSGSNGYLLLKPNEILFWTDGRYSIQAKDELPKNSKIVISSQKKLVEFIKENLGKEILTIDPLCFSITQIKQFSQYGIEINELEKNLVDELWRRKVSLNNFIEIFPLKYSGLAHSKKAENILNKLNLREHSAYLLTEANNICWFLNLRGRDVVNTPILNSYLIVAANGNKFLFWDGQLNNDKLKGYFSKNKIFLKESHEIYSYLQSFDVVKFDPNLTNYSFIKYINNSLEIADPINIAKAIKNEVEIENIKKAHFLDGIALTKFLHDLEYNKIAKDELEAIGLLENYRRENKQYIAASFSTIMGADSNGAIIHYRADKKTNKKFHSNSIILIDSGGQYYQGTTDVTRVSALGEITDAMQTAYSLVLKGHIALLQTKFPKNTTGTQIDSLARQFLWQNKLDYAHGTGHGVGMFLNVHEGPQSISSYQNNIVLKEGMVLSIEPGYYLENEFGIRIENLAYVKNAGDGFLKFENLTLVPYAKKLINIDLLSSNEIMWLNNYHLNLQEIFNNKINQQTQDYICKQII